MRRRGSIHHSAMKRGGSIHHSAMKRGESVHHSAMRRGGSIHHLVFSALLVVFVVIRPAACGCPGGMELFEGSCWFLETDPQTFTGARSFCGAYGGDLVPVTNRPVQDKLQEMVVAAIADTTDERFWLGLERADGSAPYQWVSNGVTSQDYTHWLDHWNDTLDEPVEDDALLCAVFLHLPTEQEAAGVDDFRFGWAAWDCAMSHPFFCRAPTSPGVCSLPLLSGDAGLPPDAVTSSSVAVVEGVSSLLDAGLGTQVGLDNHTVGAWLTEDLHSLDYYIQVDLQQPYIVREVRTQGRHDPSDTWRQWTRSYHVDYSTDGQTWTRYGYPQSEQVPQLLKGNSDSDSIVTQTLYWPFYARYVRLNPIGHRNAMALRWELAGCPLPVDGGTNLALGQTVDIHRTDHYRTYGWDIRQDLGSLTDGNELICKTIPSEDFHPAWPFHVRIPVSTPINHAIVTLVGNNLPCQQNFGSQSLWGIVSVHSPDDSNPETYFFGKFRHCDLLEELRATTPTPVTCRFLCTREPPGVRISQVFVSVEETPTEPDENRKWSICDVKVQQTD